MKPSLRSMLDPERVSRGLADAGAELSGSAPLRLQRAWPSGRGGLSAVWDDAGSSWAVHATATVSRRAARAGSRSVLLLPELGCWAHRSSEDPELPQLREALDPERAEVRLSPWLPGGRPVRTARAISYKPLRRCVVSVADGAIVVKLFRPGRAGDSASRYAALDRGADLGPLRVADPVGVCDDWSALVWSPSPGEPLLARLCKPDGPVAAAAVGSGLAGLQRSSAGWSERHDAASELATVARWVAVAAAAFPEAASRLASLQRALAGTAPPPGSEPLAPAHRDFHDGQILVSDQRLTLLDLDTACLAAAELDVANFLAHLRLRELEGHRARWAPIAAGFLSGWEGTAGRSGLSSQRLRWYEASAFLRLACVYAFRPVWSALSEDLLAEAQLRLDVHSPDEGENR